LWSSDEPQFSGRFFSFRDVVLEPRPHRQPGPPVWVGGNTRRQVRRSIEHGDGWVPWQLAFDELAELISYGRELIERRGSAAPWHVVAPFPTIDLLGRGAGGAAPDVLRAAPADVAAEIERYRALGVDRLHVGFVSTSCDELLDQLEAFATQVAVLL
jgi:alkanesulfonate monooxygenase SsuD/methylene tetrahydromethanopterin reductase-like flavin-dependent oxidoreductase (luciferase family)